MSVNGKRDGSLGEELLALAKAADITKARADQMIKRTVEVIRRWPDFAAEAKVDDKQVMKIKASQRTSLSQAMRDDHKSRCNRQTASWIL